MCSGTVSKIDLILKINGNKRIRCQLKRHLSPITVGLITRMLPLKGNAHQMSQSVVYFETKINSGVERKRINFKKGDIAFLPTGGCICFCTSDINSGQPMTPIGKIITNIENFTEVKTGDILLLYSETL